MKASSADIHNILRKTELRTVLRSKNRLFSTQGNGTQRSTQLNQVIRARISGRKVFVSLDYDHVPTPQQKPVTSN